MTLTEFLATASPDDSQALAAAKDHPATRYTTINGNEAQQFFCLMGAMQRLKDSATSTTPATIIPNTVTTVGQLVEAMLATMVNGANGKFSTDPSQEDGQLNRAAANELITAGVLTADEVAGFFAIGEHTSKPFSAATLHQVKIIRGTLTYKTPATQGNYALITTLGATERHNPRLLAENPRTGELQRISNFYGVQKAGIYETIIPAEWRTANLLVDDAYGVI